MPAPKPGVKKDSTSDVPMHDLEEVIRFITKIHEAGLETASMPEIAKGCGYGNATSTPFYRRILASRLFGFLAKTGAELTVRARDYLKPDSDGADQRALADAIFSIQPYSEIVDKFKGKKLNTELVANGLSKSFNLSDACAKNCAKVFESSLKFAGFLAADLTVAGEVAIITKPKSKTKEHLSEHEEEEKEADEEDLGLNVKTQSHTIYLDKTKKRKFQVIAPIDITTAELKRAKGFLDFALIVDQPIPPIDEEETA